MVSNLKNGELFYLDENHTGNFNEDLSKISENFGDKNSKSTTSAYNNLRIKRKQSEKSNIEFNNEKFMNYSHINGYNNSNNGNLNGNGVGNENNSRIIDLSQYNMINNNNKNMTMTSIGKNNNNINNNKEENKMVTYKLYFLILF